MTEIEKITYAKLFIDKMAMGQNPIDNTPIPEGDTLNQVRISRCLFYVSSILGQVIELGGIPPIPTQAPQDDLKKKEKKLPFCLTREQIAEISLSEKAVPASVILEKLNAPCPQNMKRLPAYKFYDWLQSLGIYEKSQGEDGLTRRTITPFGAEIGVSMEMKNGRFGPYAVIVYSQEAQAFLLDNIEGLFEHVKKLSQGSRFWTKEEEELLVSYFEQGKSIPEIAQALSRTHGAVRRRLKKLGFIE